MIEINLIPDVKRELLKAQRTRGIVISVSIFTSFVALGVVVLLLAYMYGVQWARGAVLDGQMNDKGTKLAAVEDLSKILTIQNQLATISDLNNSKNMSSRIFEVMSAVTPPEANAVSFSQVTVSPSDDTADAAAITSSTTAGGQISLEGQTTGYDSLEVFKKIISNTVIKYTKDGEEVTENIATNISTGDISYGEDAAGKKVLRFALSFEYPEALFSPQSTALSYKRNVDGNITDSYLGIPRFTDRSRDLEEGN